MSTHGVNQSNSCGQAIMCDFTRFLSVELEGTMRGLVESGSKATKGNGPSHSHWSIIATYCQSIFWIIKVFKSLWGDRINKWKRNSLEAAKYTETTFHRGNASNSEQLKAGTAVGRLTMCFPCSYSSFGNHLGSLLKMGY